ncbi:MAG: hypothetical protein FJX62_21830 [Alphaproteobacteria bacterium]|nr:hypothetical protein [Alphaproteobacteria bacterium]
MGSVIRAASLAAAVILFAPLQAGAASNGAKSYGAKSHSIKSYSTATSQSRAATSGPDVPANCIRQACGSLWCWKMGNQTR